MDAALPPAVANQTPPEVLFHYTSYPALYSIVRSGALWATLVHYSNDRREFSAALDQARAGLQQIRRKNDDNLIVAEAAQGLHDELSRISRIIVCVFSLSAHGDLLSQWRGYCPREGGLSLGFRSSALAEVAASHGFRLLPCVYDINKHLHVVAPILKQAVDRIAARRARGEDAKRALNAEMWRFFGELAAVAPMIKDPSFREEAEWRLVSTPLETHALSFRATAGMLIPHFSIPVPLSEVLEHVIIGPHAHQDLALNSTIDFLTAGKVKWHQVSPSHIPFRTL